MRGLLTSTTRIEVLVQALTGADTGGDPILSYNIEYDTGTSGATWTELQGYSSNSLALSVIEAGLAVATNY